MKNLIWILFLVGPALLGNEGIRLEKFKGKGMRHFSAEQREKFEKCLADNKIPSMPEPNEATRQAFQECRGETKGSNKAGFRDCLKSKGVELPPKLTPEQRAQMKECHKKAE